MRLDSILPNFKQKRLLPLWFSPFTAPQLGLLIDKVGASCNKLRRNMKLLNMSF
jgi:hypothetical protein